MKILSFEFSEKNFYGVHFLLIPIILLLTIYLAYWQGQYNYDPHHWGLILSNAKDLYYGKLPYKDIFLQYGYLTTLIQAGFFSINKNISSIIISTAFFHALSLLLIFLITHKISKSYRIASYTIFIAFLMHPIVNYPWSNYFSFTFILLAVYFYSLGGKYSLVLTGISSGLAILAREGVAPALILSFFISFIIQYSNHKALAINYWKNLLKDFFAILLGVTIPIAIFIFYLIFNDLVFFWHKLSWDLPKIYFNYFPDARHPIKGYILFFYDLYLRSINSNYRWLFFGLIFISNLFLLLSQIKNSSFLKNKTLLLISLLSFALITSTLHIHEMFKLITGSLIGIISLFVLLERINLLNFLFPFFIIALAYVSFSKDSENRFYPTVEVVGNSEFVSSPKIFYGQNWPKGVSKYYQEIERDYSSLKEKNCGIKYHYNGSMDSFIQVLSPFQQYQLAPYDVSSDFSALRPDLNLKMKINEKKDLIMLISVAEKDIPFYKTPKGFFIYKQHLIPYAIWLPPKQALLIVVPNSCKS